MHRAAGTSLAGACGRSTRSLYESQVAPRLAAAPALFPPAACGFDAFARAADMVQTRAFHMRSDNWLTGASQVGGVVLCGGPRSRLAAVMAPALVMHVPELSLSMLRSLHQRLSTTII